MIVIPLRFFDMPNALFLEILAWFTQALPGLSDLRIFCWTLHARYRKKQRLSKAGPGKFHGLFLDVFFFSNELARSFGTSIYWQLSSQAIMKMEIWSWSPWRSLVRYISYSPWKINRLVHPKITQTSRRNIIFHPPGWLCVPQVARIWAFRKIWTSKGIQAFWNSLHQKKHDLLPWCLRFLTMGTGKGDVMQHKDL